MTDNAPDIVLMMMLYNNEADIRQALDSLVAQTYRNFHLIVVDDASRDKSFEIAQEYKSCFDHITLLKNSANKGTIGNLHYSLGLCEALVPSAMFFMWTCGDDWWEPEFLEKTRAGLLANPDAIVSYCNFEQVNVTTGIASERILCSIQGSGYAEARKIFLPYKTKSGTAYFNSVIHGLIRISDLRYIFPNTESGLLAMNSVELAYLIAMLMRGSILVLPEMLFHKRKYGLYVERHPDDFLSITRQNILKRIWLIFSHLPRFLVIRRPDRSIIFAVLMWAHLLYFYGLESCYMKICSVIRKKENAKRAS